MNEFLAAFMSFLTIIITFATAIAGAVFFLNGFEKTALFAFLGLLPFMMFGWISCSRIQACREWLFAWLWPF